MDHLIRNIDESAYRVLAERAITQGKSVDEVVNEALQAWSRLPRFVEKRGSLRDLPIKDLGPGTEHLSEEINSVLYGK